MTGLSHMSRRGGVPQTTTTLPFGGGSGPPPGQYEILVQAKYKGKKGRKFSSGAARPVEVRGGGPRTTPLRFWLENGFLNILTFYEGGVLKIFVGLDTCQIAVKMI
jgi:hypothetical protein